MEGDKDCIFCKIVRGEILSKKVFEDKNFIGILDVNPRAEGHTLIISKNHYKTLLDLPCYLGNELLDAIKCVFLDSAKDGKADGFNTIVNTGKSSGQVVDHVHVHVIPRKKDDGLKIG